MGHSRTPTQNTAGDGFPADPIDGSVCAESQFEGAPPTQHCGQSQSCGSGAVLAAHQPVDHRVPHLEWGEHSPEPSWASDLGVAPLAEIPQRDSRHDGVEDDQGCKNPAARLPTAHGPMVLRDRAR
jgi:hypothetical protein